MTEARQPARRVDGATPLEFTSAEQLKQHYIAVKRRMKPVPLPVDRFPAPPPEPPEPLPKEVPPALDNPDDEWERLPVPEVISLPSGPVGNATRTEILYAVARAARVSVAEMRSQQRRQALVQARFVYYVLARSFSGSSLPQIGMTAGGRDHTTVIHGLRKGAEMFRTLYPIYRAACMELCLPLPDVRRYLEYTR